MSSALLRFSLGISAARNSARGVYLLAEHQCFNTEKSISDRKYSTSYKTRDDKNIKKFDSDEEAEIIQKLRNTFAEEEKYGGVVPIFKKALLYGNKIAIKDQVGEYSYVRLYNGAKKLCEQISNLVGSASCARVAFLCPNDAIYPMVQWACWFSGQIAVPLSTRHPTELLKYFIKDSEATLLITTPEYEPVMKPIAESLDKILIVIDHSFLPEFDPQSSWLDPKNENIVQYGNQVGIASALNSTFYANSKAMILYTSGTTGKPKGAVLSHKNINAQVNNLVDAWHFSAKDCLLHVLPLNHVHGCVNALMCPLSVGAKLLMQDHFDSHNVWSALLGINAPAKDRVNLFMGVPTIYNFLIDEYDKIFAKNSRMVEYIQNHCEKNIRLMISGSAPLPTTVFNRWFEISGHRLLERYGMTEIGMALSNPYMEDKVRTRKPGCVGLPLPSVEVRLVDADNKTLYSSRGESNKGIWSKTEQPVYEKTSTAGTDQSIAGELQVKGPTVFVEYWNRPEETQKEFVDGFFKTGDVASFENGVFKILGRLSTDIIKTGGYKVSALEIETHLLEHPNIKDVAIIGAPDETWGQRVVAFVVMREKMEFDLKALQTFCSEKIAPYAAPTELKIVDEIPRNAMGKINKKDIIKVYSSEFEKN